MSRRIAARGVGTLVLAGFLASCSSAVAPGVAPQTAARCLTSAACNRLAAQSGVPTPIVQIGGPRNHFVAGFIYAKTKSTGTWSFRLDFTDAADKVTLEEDAFQLQFSPCPSGGRVQDITLAAGQTVCYLSEGKHSTLRYDADGILYQLSLLPPFSDLSDAQTEAALVAAAGTMSPAGT